MSYRFTPSVLSPRPVVGGSHDGPPSHPQAPHAPTSRLSLQRDSPARAGESETAPWPIRDESIVLRDVALESGDVLEHLTVRYRLEGALTTARDNVVLVVHALTGDAHASAWWRGVVGEQQVIDPTRHAVLCANLLGGCSGTTACSDAAPRTEAPPLASPAPPAAFTTRDQAAVLARLLDALGIATPRLVCGGSLGGMVALEFAASFPERSREVVVLAAPAAQTAQGIAWNALMRRAIALDTAQDGSGLALARMIGMLSYRTADGLERRFGRAADRDGRFLVEQWLTGHGTKLVSRFDATSYRALIGAMDTHDIGRGRGGICAALAPVRSRITGVGIVGDLLYPADAVREWTKLAGVSYREIDSPHGHDAFLLETARVSSILAEALARSEVPGVADVTGLRSNAHGAVTAPPTHAVPLGTAPALPVHRNGARVRRGIRPLRVALAGCGTVGSALLELLPDHDDTTQPIEVVRVLARDPARLRPALVDAFARGVARTSRCITDPTRLLGDDIDVLVEAIGGTSIAATLVEGALRRGIRVVTANKALLAERGAALATLAATNETSLDFEAAVAGAVPVVRCLRAQAAGVGVSGFTGILNGTSNFVLERVADGDTLSDAIAAAQRHGYAEADPTRDLSGEDVEDKLRVLAWLAFGVDPSSLRVQRRGIDAETAAWAARVAAEGDRVKLLASCVRDGEGYIARVVPTRVAGSDAWAEVTGPANRIVIDSASAGALVFHGAGAGGRATGGALLSDLLAHSPRALAR